jgi:hypothetical protein
MPRRTNPHRQLRSILHNPVLLRQLLSPLETAVRQTINAEKEASWFPQLPVLAHLLAGIFFQVQQLASLRDLVTRLGVNRQKGLLQGFEIKLSTLGHANNSPRRLRVLRQVFAHLVATSSGSLPGSWRRLRRIAALDSTLLDCVPSATWASYRRDVNACKGHLLFDLASSIPKHLMISTGRCHDARFFEQFQEVGWTYIVDRAYNHYRLFDQMTQRGIYFVCRLKVGSVYSTAQKHRVRRADRHRGVLHDITVRLGAGSTQMATPVRWVRFRTAEGRVYDYATNRFDLSPLTIAQLYEARWAIEKFFKWLKCTLRMERCLGRSAEAYEIHILTTLITDILLKLLVGLPPLARHIPVHVLRLISEHLFARVSSTLTRTIRSAADTQQC